jgi:hypothetical protein
MFRKSPLSTLVIVMSLALGIAANTAIFSVMDTLLLRPLPYPHAERLAAVWLHSPALAIARDWWPSPGQYLGIHAADPTAVVYGIRTMQERLHDSLARQRFASVMLAAFAAFAMLLAAMGFMERCLI